MDYAIVCLVSLLVSGLTLFSGFGLGTLLLPAFAFFFPVEVAIAATAIVHLANNLFKLVLVGKMASWKVTIIFTLPAVLASVFGAMLLVKLGKVSPLASYTLFGRELWIEPVKLTIGAVIVFFALFDLVPGWSRLNVSSRYLPIGGALSGFFGGLSGMQGALRSLFLVRAGLTKEQFIGTGVVSAVIIDVSRLLIYGTALVWGRLATLAQAGITGLVVAGTAAALVGTLLGSRLVQKVTLDIVQRIVGALLLIVGVSLAAGWI